MREVDEALREDQALDLIKRWGKPLGAAIFLGLAGLGAWIGWDYYQDQGRAERAAKRGPERELWNKGH